MEHLGKRISTLQRQLWYLPLSKNCARSLSQKGKPSGNSIRASKSYAQKTRKNFVCFRDKLFFFRFELSIFFFYPFSAPCTPATMWIFRHTSHPPVWYEPVAWDHHHKCKSSPGRWQNWRGSIISESSLAYTWRIIPVSKWLVTPIYKPFSPFGRGTTLLRGLTNHG